MTMKRLGFVIATLALGVSVPLTAHPAPSVDGAIEALKPGSYLWAPEIAPLGPVTIIISLKTQRAYAYRNGVPIGVSTISTGKPGHETPTGIFVILQKEIDHKSSLYDDAPMPYMQRLTWDGIALHAGNLPGYPASHGCIRLPGAFAKLLFGVTKLGLTVVINDDPDAPEIAPDPRILDQGEPVGNASAPDFRWQPQKSASGPVSIVVSGRDRKLVVLRNGVEIGSSTISIDGPIVSTKAFTLRATDQTGSHWMRLPLPGQTDDAEAELSAHDRARARFPEEFRLKLLTVLKPGATLLITRDSLKSSGTGTRLTLVTSGPK
ncbi:L,D-transpeptidase [soil metagenome]